MEFIVKKFEILREISLTQGVVEKKTTIPILANLLMDARGENVHLAATDLELGIKTNCRAKVKKEGCITTPAKSFLDIIRSLPDADIKIKRLENDWVQITCGSASFKIVGLPSDNFPALPELKENLVDIPALVLLNLINKTIFAIASEESRYTLNGALLLVKPLSVTMVSTDGHRLAHIEKQANFENLNTEVRVLIPKKALAELQRLLAEAEEGDLISFGKDATHLFFRLKNRLMISRMLTGQFPNYDAVLPKENSKTIILNREEIGSAVKRVSLLADDKSRAIRILLDNNKLEISSSNTDLGEAKETLETDYTADPLQIGFNCQYLLDFLSVTQDSSVSFDFKDEQSAGQLRPATEEDYHYRYIVMPMRV
ncbi:MAG: DNA polymerase III subunit beta [Acidobacteria bacterium]|nr:MAG: DNA polymerase III subunit beta [Acidobacteriota bacterium]